METIEKNRIAPNEVPEGLFGVMLNTEKYLSNSGLPHSLMKLIKNRASQINKCGYCIDMHHKEAMKAGEQIQRLYLLPAWEESPCYTEAEKAALNLTDVLTVISQHDSGSIENAFDRMRPYFSAEEIANIILAICQINSWNRISITFGNEPGSYKG